MIKHTTEIFIYLSDCTTTQTASLSFEELPMHIDSEEVSLNRITQQSSATVHKHVLVFALRYIVAYNLLSALRHGIYHSNK